MMFRNPRRFYLYVYLLIAGIVVAACGGEQLAGGGIGGTGISSGTVTGFGSIFVNGVEFDTSGATRIVDDMVTVSTGSDDDTVLAQGMVVSVTGTVNADGVTGTATTVEFDEIVEGPIGSIPVEDVDMTTKTFDVLGLQVVVDRNLTVFTGTDFDYTSIRKDDMVEVSGFFDATGTLFATHIDKVGVLMPDSVVEVHGTVSGSGVNGVDTFMLGSLLVTFNGATLFEGLPGTVSDGQFVEASGTLAGPASINAMRIELEEDSITNAGPVSLEGIVTRFNGIGDLTVSGQQVDASGADFSPASLETTLGTDDRVEIEGTLAGGVLTATEVESRTGSLKIGGQVTQVTAVDVVTGIVSIEVVMGQPDVAVNIDSQTQLEDEQFQVQPFTLNDLAFGDGVVVEGILGNGGAVIAAKLKRKVLERHELQGPVESVGANSNSAAGSITVLGVAFTTNDSTEFEDINDQSFPNGGDDFYAQVVQDDLVEIEDDVPVDGVADEVELKN
jgi:hypothetical protein